MGLAQWYSVTPNAGLTLGFAAGGGRSVEVEYNYVHYLHGSIEERKFYWPVDRKFYKSPDAKADMVMHNFMVNFNFPYNDIFLGGKKFSTYFSVGSGFYAYFHHVSGLTYPGQSKEPIDLSFHLPATKDDQVAMGLNLGAGTEITLTSRIHLDLRLRYNLILGSMRPFEDWGIKEVFPVQMLDFRFGLKYLL